MKKILQSLLAVAVLVVCSTLARAVWDSTTGNMPNSYNLCWGLNSTACIYGSTISNYVRIQIGGVDKVTVTSTGMGVLNTAPSVALDVTGAAKVSSTLAVTGAITAPGANVLTIQMNTTTQLAARTDPPGTVSISESLLAGVPDLSELALCVSTAASIDSYVYLSTHPAAGMGTACH